MDSVAAFEPGVDRIVLCSDGSLKPEDVSARVVEAAELAIHCSVPLAAMSTYYDALELNTALKPWCFGWLIEQYQQVVYLDPDVSLYHDLSPVWSAFETSDALLTPHLCKPGLSGDGRPTILEILRAGAYNLGFLGLQRSEDTTNFLQWWSDRCRFDCRVDFNSGLFTDQRWVDLAPGFFARSTILRDEGLNVAYWNIGERPLKRIGDRLMAGPRPLRFFHFSGFNPERPDLLSHHQNRVWPRDDAALAALLSDYALRMRRAGSRTALKRPYGFDTFPDGERVSRAMRKAFLEAAREGRDLSDGLSSRQQAWARGKIGPAAALPRAERRIAEIGETAGGPWSGPAAHAAQWLRQSQPGLWSNSLIAFWRASPRVRSVDALAAEDMEEVVARSIGPEAVEGRFAVDLLSDDVQRLIVADTGRLAIRAVRRWRPDLQASNKVRLLIARYGLSGAAGWPEALVRDLATLAAVSPDVERTLWEDRSDLQKAFAVHSPLGRLRFRRWIAKVAVRDYGLWPDSLPKSLRSDPVFSVSLPRARLQPWQAPRGAVDRLWSSATSPPDVPSWFDPTDGRIAGTALRPPASVMTCVHHGELAEAALAWFAFRRQGIGVRRHIWLPAAGAKVPSPHDPAWSFVDAVAGDVDAFASGPRPFEADGLR